MQASSIVSFGFAILLNFEFPYCQMTRSFIVVYGLVIEIQLGSKRLR